MTKFEQLDTMLEQGNGYITTRAVTAQGISKPYFAEYARSRELERVAHGVYQSPDAWPDDMYILHLRNSNIIFSHQSALALHGMMEREPHHIYVTVKQGYNATHLRKQGVIVHTVSPEIFTLGLSCKCEKLRKKNAGHDDWICPAFLILRIQIYTHCRWQAMQSYVRLRI